MYYIKERGAEVMMQVSNVKAIGNHVQTVKKQPDVAVDIVSKEIQGRIMDAQKRRQELSSDMEMSAEEKADIRQKIQQEISDLKRELRQRQAEEKKKQQEAQKAEEADRQQKESAARDTVKEQQKTQSAQETDNRRQDNMTGSDNDRKAAIQEAGEDNREALPGVMQKSMSTASMVRQVRIVTNIAAQAEGNARIREAEINQDAARGVDVEGLKKEQREAVEQKARYTQRVQSFMFEGKSDAAELDAGTVKQISGGFRGKGLYGSSGTMFKTNFQSVQMDLKQ